MIELNAEDGGQRRFILCSSTESTEKEPGKNLCRDVCAERIRRVMQKQEKNQKVKESFAYLKTDLFELADISEASENHAIQLIALRELRSAITPNKKPVQQIAGNNQLAILLCRDVNEETIETLTNWPAERIAVYSSRASTVREQLESRGMQVNSYSIQDALMRGQISKQAM